MTKQELEALIDDLIDMANDYALRGTKPPLEAEAIEKDMQETRAEVLDTLFKAIRK